MPSSIIIMMMLMMTIMVIRTRSMIICLAGRAWSIAAPRTENRLCCDGFELACFRFISPNGKGPVSPLQIRLNWAGCVVHDQDNIFHICLISKFLLKSAQSSTDIIQRTSCTQPLSYLLISFDILLWV